MGSGGGSCVTGAGEGASEGFGGAGGAGFGGGRRGPVRGRLEAGMDLQSCLFLQESAHCTALVRFH